MQNPDLNKVTVFPQVVIYKNLLKDVDSILNIFKKSESGIDDEEFFADWLDWSPGKDTPGSIMTVPARNRSVTIYETDSDLIKEQKKAVSKIYDAFNTSLDDYFKDWANKGIWPDLISNWDTNDTKSWRNCEINVLTYSSLPNESSPHDPKSGKFNLPMNYHVDNMKANLDNPGDKLSVTVTMYLNDDYEGGEISFYDAVANKVYKYKPKPGDITVFPSFEPFYHGVLPMTGGPRYLVRSFLMYDYEGSEDWHKDMLTHSLDECQELYKKKRADAFSRRDFMIRVLYNGDINDMPQVKSVLVEEEPILID